MVEDSFVIASPAAPVLSLFIVPIAAAHHDEFLTILHAHSPADRLFKVHDLLRRLTVARQEVEIVHLEGRGVRCVGQGQHVLSENLTRGNQVARQAELGSPVTMEGSQYDGFGFLCPDCWHHPRSGLSCPPGWLLAGLLFRCGRGHSRAPS